MTKVISKKRLLAFLKELSTLIDQITQQTKAPAKKWSCHTQNTMKGLMKYLIEPLQKPVHNWSSITPANILKV